MQRQQRQRSRDKKSKKTKQSTKIQDHQIEKSIKIQESNLNSKEQQIIKKYHKFIRDQQSQQKIDSQDSQVIKQRLKKYRRYNLSELVQKQGERLAKKYYSKLYKQYALVDLSRYQTGQIGCRWRTQKQVIQEKGESICAAIDCSKQALNAFQMNFTYKQGGIKKNALVKISVCKECAHKLNFKKRLKMIEKNTRKIEAQLEK